MAELMLAEGPAGQRPIQVDADGKLVVSASVAAPEGGATEAKQDDVIAALAGGLPLALTAGGGVKVGVVDALPAGANTIGAVTGPAGEQLATSAGLSAISNVLVNLLNQLSTCDMAEAVDLGSGDWTPSGDVNIPLALFVGTGGALVVDMAGGGTVTYGNVPSGTWLKINVSKVYQSGTLASNLVLVGLS